jgi:hypothetical protein
VMPWHVFRGMTDEALKSIFAYLKTWKSVRHRVDNTEKPTSCPLGKWSHGQGDTN